MDGCACLAALQGGQAGASSLLLAAPPKLLTPMLQVVHRVITRHLLGTAGLKAEEADSGAVS